MRILSFWAETHQLSVCLIHCSPWRGRTRVDWVRSFPLTSREEAGPLLRQLLAAQPEPASIRVVTSLPAGLVLVRRDRFPTRKRKQLEQLLSYHTDTLVPFPAHERVVSLTSAVSLGEGECEATVWIAYQHKVSQEIAFWAEQEVPLHALCCEPAALHRYGTECSAPDGTYLLIHSSYTCAVSVAEGAPVRSITISRPAEEPLFDHPIPLQQIPLPDSLECPSEFKASPAAPILLGQAWDLAHEDSDSVDLLAAAAAPAWRAERTRTRQLQACAALFTLLGALWCGHSSVWHRACHHLQLELGISSSSLTTLEEALGRREEALDKLAAHTRIRAKTNFFAQQLGQLCAAWPSSPEIRLDRVAFAGTAPPSLTIVSNAPEEVHKLCRKGDMELHEGPEPGRYRLTLRPTPK